MKVIPVKTFLTLILTLITIIPVSAQPPAEFRSPQRDRMDMMDKLKLTDKQKDEIQTLRYSHEKVMIGLRADLKMERLTMKKLRQADDPNKKKIYAQLGKISAAELAIEKAKVDQMLALRKILTPEQFKRFRKERQSGKMLQQGPPPGIGKGHPGRHGAPRF